MSENAAPTVFRLSLQTVADAGPLPLERLQGHAADCGFAPTAAWTAAGDYFSLDFAFASVAAGLQARKRLLRHAAWQDALRLCGSPRYWLGVRSAPAGPGRVIQAGPGLRRSPWHSLGGRDGLPASSVHAVLPDAVGNLWLCTDGGGLCRYDGAAFTVWDTTDGLAGNSVLSAGFDRQGRLWLGTAGQGLSCFDGEALRNYTVVDGMASGWIDRIVAADGQMLFASRAGVTRFDFETFRPCTDQVDERRLSNPRCDAYRDREGRLWVIGPEGRLCRHADGETRPVGGDGRPGHRQILGEDGDGRLWLNGDHGLRVLQGDALQTPEAPDLKNISSMAVDARGRLWLASATQGLRCRDGGSWKAFGSDDGLANNQVLCAAADSEGQLWFGTLGGGVCTYDDSLRVFGAKDGLPDDGVMALHLDPPITGRDKAGQAPPDGGGLLWCGTWSGACAYDGRRFAPFEPMAGKNVWAIHRTRRGDLYFGALDQADEASLGRYGAAGFRAYRTADGLSNSFVSSLAEDGSGRLYCGTGLGLDVFDGEAFAPLAPGGAPLREDAKVLLVDRRGALWFSTIWTPFSERRLCRWDGRALDVVLQGEDEVGNGVWCMYQDSRDRLWCGTMGMGVYCIEEEGRRRHFTGADGLMHDWVHAILEDERGHLLFGTHGGGVGLYDGRVFQTLSQRDGLPHDAVQALASDGGAVWIATEGGLARYRPRRQKPRIEITDVVADQRHGNADGLSLSAAHELVAFEFRGSSFSTAPDRLAYVYRLEGLHDPWRVSYTGRVEYESIAPGEYTFEVRAVDRDLNYSEPARLRLIVEPDSFRQGVAGVLSEDADFVWQGPALGRVIEQLRQVAPTDWTVLVRGETGTGKGMAARALHRISARCDQPFIPVNCGAIPDGLVESELFGHEKGAFTGATGRRVGKAELAAGGTLFLDEIGDMPLAAQVKLLRFLEERAFERLGGEQTIRADARVVAATNRDLEEAMRQGHFRQDLFYRLSAFAVEIPPLRQRREDVVPLMRHFVQRFALHLNRPEPAIAPSVLARLEAYGWPGNVRELEHLAQRAVLVCRDDRIEPTDLGLSVSDAAPATAAMPASLKEFDRQSAERERRFLQQILERTDGKIYGKNGAAQLLGVHPETLRSRIKRLGAKSPAPDPASNTEVDPDLDPDN